MTDACNGANDPGPASDAPAPPPKCGWCEVEMRRTADGGWQCGECENVPLAASPAQEATPPRCPSEGPEGQPCGRTPGHFGRHACSHDGNERLWDDSTARAAPTPEASAPGNWLELAEAVFPNSHSMTKEERAAFDASTWPDVEPIDIEPTAPAREASSAPGEPRTAKWAIDALHTIAMNMRCEGLTGSRPDVLDEVAATVAALTAERTRLHAQLNERQEQGG